MDTCRWKVSVRAMLKKTKQEHHWTSTHANQRQSTFVVTDFASVDNEDLHEMSFTGKTLSGAISLPWVRRLHVFQWANHFMGQITYSSNLQPSTGSTLSQTVSGKYFVSSFVLSNRNGETTVTPSCSAYPRLLDTAHTLQPSVVLFYIKSLSQCK